jgi:hypothetical protein
VEPPAQREFPDDSSAHRTFRRWVRLGVFDRLWAVLLEACEDSGGCDWEWQAADTATGKARFGGNLVGPNPTDRAKPAVKPSLLVEADGGPLGVIVAGANVPDARLLAATLEVIVAERPKLNRPQHPCLDKGYDNETGWGVVVEHGYTSPTSNSSETCAHPPPQEVPHAKAVGGRAYASLALEVPRDPGPLGQEGRQLPAGLLKFASAP